MKIFRINHLALLTVSAIVFASALSISAQKVTMQISATAMGTNQQMGRIINVDVRIFGYSTADDQKGLLEAFGEMKSEGLSNALYKMGAKGRISVTGTLGYDLKYVREFKMADGSRRIRFVTDRPITFGEHWSMSRSMDYALTMGEIIIRKGKDKSTGTLMPAAKFRLDKDGDLEIETFQNPWNLTNIRVWK